MIRKFKILDSSPNDWYGYLNYDTSKKEFSIDLRDNINVSTCPPFFDVFIDRKQLHIDHEWAIRWVRERMMPPGRHAIGVALREMGLEEYDEFHILLYFMGHCDMDNCYIEEVNQM